MLSPFSLTAANCSDGEIRLVDGSTEYNGWVQICFSKTWGTICSNLWDSRDASVACNQLGYSAIGNGKLLIKYKNCLVNSHPSSSYTESALM